jgi:hypothetical protein
MAMNFADALNTKVGEIERPPLIPSGTYRAVVKKVPVIDTIADGKWDVLDFTLQLVEAQEDVDQQDLASFGGLSNATMTRHRFMFNKEDDAAFKRTLFNLKRFLAEHLGVEAGDNTPLKESLNASVNTQCLVFMKWRADKNDPEVQYSEVGRTAPVA